MVSSRPQTAVAGSISGTTDLRSAGAGFGRRARRRLARREFLALPAMLALMAPAPALAQAAAGTSSTGTSGYNQKPPTPTTTPEPKKEVEHSKEATTPKTSPAPVTTTPTSTVEPTTTATPKASTLPFTGLNLTWIVGAGVILLAAGLSIRIALRQRPGAGG
jgi:hypothetical protein